MTEARQEASANGPGAAAILSAAVGCLTLGVLALTGDAFPAAAAALNLWKPTGPLSGVTDVAILVWLCCWLLLSRRWARRTVDLAKINWASLAMILAALLLTFPPTMDLLQGR